MNGRSETKDAVTGLYERRAEDWDRDRGKDLFERPWLDRFTAGLKPGASILDVGCGSGEPIARHLIGQGFALSGVDSSPALIAMCSRRFPGAD